MLARLMATNEKLMNKEPAYLGTPYSEIKRYDPDPDHPGQGCITLISSPYRDYPKILKPGAGR